MIDGVRERLVEAVRLRLRSDVPLGLYLSGGIDSAAVAGIAASLLKEKDPDAKLATFTLAFPQSGVLDEGPIARRMAATIGADVHMIEPTETDLVENFEPAVWHAEQPTLTLHGAGKVILSKFVREQGYKVILSGEGSDEVFGGYSFLLLDYLRDTDPASVSLGFPLPAKDELDMYLKTVEAMKPPQDHVSISNMSFTDATMGRDMYGGISTHRVWATSSPPPDLFTAEVLQKVGGPELTQIIAEGFDARAREKAITGQWHPLHMGLVSAS
ncbi:hypothetical protein SERLA73DRAFT_51048 [Serpula lacrymans var. lacrymans S7.3]|uniref:Asparagine synthetase domain-containing protein n=1 Tax=Serpula lacrymans var. lacrymans (strain S7.3) TaxID=936435 RepID=F8PSJ0_SERL3|nr:hypothetical protein SERLA73DRAFT_51048 [Serpula lacrymans var. lacrymans S7.3]